MKAALEGTRVIHALDRTDLLADPRFTSNSERLAHLAELVEALDPTFRSKTTGDWLGILEAAGVPSGPMFDLEEVYRHPQVQARDMELEVTHATAGTVKAIGMPVKYGLTPGRINSPAPLLGEHTKEILTSLGLSGEAISELQASGVINPAGPSRQDDETEATRL